MDAAQVFTKAKHLIKPQVKKCQFPIRRKDKSLLKIKMSPMEWKPRTSKKPGRYQKVILEEAPPRILVPGTEDYDELIRIAQDAFWTEKEREGSTFTLCHSDGTRWTKEQFCQEYGSVSEIPTPWKRTFYIGRREMDIICLGESSSALGNDEMEDSDMIRVQGRPQFQRSKLQLLIQRGPWKKVFAHKMRLYSQRLPLVDESLINYSEQNMLGEGTFGKVYRGSFQGTPAAIKRIPYGIAGLQDQDIQHEILVAMRLSHPNIVRLMAAAHTENTFLLANEYIHGTTLDNVLHSDNACVKLEGNDSHFVALDISMAVEYIHSKNVIHQDLKPDNILVSNVLNSCLWGC
ncbi:uncharacterized protein LOC130434548 [Triplophysa dalaica]|uniref:uncharacterized protein LOC130434548 n=1 Tax=Triplophysa dalaica TaxID=1582913 RepID=UPI0024DF49F9|nr:uncharacterized protein LOC130434548 [Triplophysa dalaica]